MGVLNKILLCIIFILIYISPALSDTTTGLIGYWSMDNVDINWNTNKIIDRSGNGNIGNLVSLTQESNSVDGKYGQALRFGGASTVINVPFLSSLDLSITGDVSYSFWIRFNSVPGSFLLALGKTTANYPSVSINGGSTISYSNYGSVSPSQLLKTYDGYKTTQTNRWYHIVCTYDGSISKIYVDNILIGSQAASGLMGNGISDFKMGTNLPCDLDEVRVYNRALSSGDVSEIYNISSISLSQLSPPPTPSNFISTSHTSTTVSFSWDINQNVKNYYIYKDNIIVAAVNNDTNNYTIRNLKPNTTYNFQLSILDNMNIEGNKSDIVQVTTDAISSLGSQYPHQWLLNRPHPVYKSGNTLLPLTKWSWDYSYDLRVEMADWGYALDFGEANSTAIGRFSNPDSTESKLVSLSNTLPDRYKLCINMPRVTPPDDVYTVDALGVKTTKWSPEAPNNSIQSMATEINTYIQEILNHSPISIVLNGGERYLGVYGNDAAAWQADPGVVAAKGSLSWSDYQSQQKSRQEMIFHNNVESLLGSSIPYIWYFTGNTIKVDNSFWYMWDWDYTWMNTVSDYPNSSIYYKEMNDGFTGNSDMLSQALNGYGHVIGYNHYLSYNWFNAGYSTNSRSTTSHADINLYRGYLKMQYTLGSIGGVAGYFAYPTEGYNAQFDSLDPPHWLQQIEVLGQIHAEFSYLEDIIRNGYLLSGPETFNSKLTSLHPAYEFPTGYRNTRVLARKMINEKRWLVTAWAADGIERYVTVNIPILGDLTLLARADGSVYDIRIVKGIRNISFLDNNFNYAEQLELPNLKPDPNNPSSRSSQMNGGVFK